MNDRYYRRQERKRKRKRNIILICCLIIVFSAGIWVYAEKAGFLKDGEDALPASTVDQGTDGLETGLEADQKVQEEPTFSDLYYYEADKEERYAAYQVKNPDMPIDEVVWRVNSYLDYDFYKHDVEADLDDPFVIVNKYYCVPEEYEPKDLVKGSGGFYMSSVVNEAFIKMQSDILKEENGKIRVVSAYRTVPYQRDLFNRYLSGDKLENVERYSARAGYSEHHTGLAIDIVGSFGSLRDFINTKEAPWVNENLYKYGFIVRYQENIESITGYESEPWHLRYIGAEAATHMRSTGIESFEEYKVKYIDHKPSNDEKNEGTEGINEI